MFLKASTSFGQTLAHGGKASLVTRCLMLQMCLLPEKGHILSNNIRISGTGPIRHGPMHSGWRMFWGHVLRTAPRLAAGTAFSSVVSVFQR